MPAWEESYLGQLRALVGDDPVVMTVGARAVVRDGEGRFLLIQRSDNGYWSFPAGTMELGQTVRDCAIRELYEETGLTAHDVTLFAIHSGVGTPRNMFGHVYQSVMHSFRVEGWEGEVLRETDETTDARFFAPDDFPEPLSGSVPATLEHLANFEKDGQLILR